MRRDAIGVWVQTLIFEGQELWRRSGRVRALAGVVVMCSWAREPTFKVPLSGAYMVAGEEVLRWRLGDLRWAQVAVLEYDASRITDKYISSRFGITGNSNPFELRRCHKNDVIFACSRYLSRERVP